MRSINSSIAIRHCADSVNCSRRFPGSARQRRPVSWGRCRTSPSFAMLKPSPRTLVSHLATTNPDRSAGPAASPRPATPVCAPRSTFRRSQRCGHNPLLRRFADRLRERRKSNMTIITAVMRKLLTLAYGVLKSGRFFDSTYVEPLTANTVSYVVSHRVSRGILP